MRIELIISNDETLPSLHYYEVLFSWRLKYEYQGGFIGIN